MINLNINIDKVEAANLWNDILKFLTIAVTVHLLLYSVDEYGELFDEKSLKIFLYITIGTLIYYLIIKKFSSQYLFPVQPQPQTIEQPVIKEEDASARRKKSKTQEIKSALKKSRSKRRNNKKVRFQ